MNEPRGYILRKKSLSFNLKINIILRQRTRIVVSTLCGLAEHKNCSLAISLKSTTVGS